jgi:[calcium/calmodulin-dependent protein kinase] kinase
MELERIRAKQGKSATLYLTRRVEGREEYQNDEDLVKGAPRASGGSKPMSGFAKILEQARVKAAKGDTPDEAKPEKASD